MRPGCKTISANLDQISSRPRTWTWTWTSVFSRPALPLEHSVCLMQEVADLLRLRLRDKRQSRSKFTSRSKSKSRLECAKEQWDYPSACGVQTPAKQSRRGYHPARVGQSLYCIP
jgi:hypothetical protein